MNGKKNSLNVVIFSHRVLKQVSLGPWVPRFVICYLIVNRPALLTKSTKISLHLVDLCHKAPFILVPPAVVFVPCCWDKSVSDKGVSGGE